jgi:hypothetical protein
VNLGILRHDRDARRRSDRHRLADRREFSGLAVEPEDGEVVIRHVRAEEQRSIGRDRQVLWTAAAAGDDLDEREQAIGPDPFRPAAFRSWLFEKVPGVFPAAVFDIASREVRLP